MGIQSTTTPARRPAHLRWAAAFVLLLGSTLRTTAQSANTPLLLPSGLAYDGSGNLFFAETGKHVLRRLTPAGVLTIVAGTGTQGYAGDQGSATTALLDSPGAIALDASANLFIAEPHNHAIRRVDALSGMITTYVHANSPVALAFDIAGNLVYADSMTHQILRVDPLTLLAVPIAGNGTQGFSGDGGQAIQAALDTPSALNFDAQGNLYLADAHNQRIRRIDAVSGIMSTVAGSGMAGFAGDEGASTSAILNLPRGLTRDAFGNLYVADSRNQRIRRIDATTGLITTVAGDGTQAFLGDGSPAISASLDTPRAVAFGSAGLLTLSDTSNNRVRQVNAQTIIQTIAGVGAITPVSTIATASTLTEPNAETLVCAVSSRQGTPGGSVVLIDGTSPIASAALSSGSVSFSTAILSAGSHTLTASYSGGGAFLPSTSAPLIVTIGAVAAPSFTLASTGASTLTVAGGTTAIFGFTVTPGGAPLSSSISLAALGLPAGATATFNPNYLPPPTGPVSFTLSFVAPVTKAGSQPTKSRELATQPALWAVLLLPLLALRRRKELRLLCLLLLAGCGDRVVTESTGASSPITYNITVNATATLSSGAVLLQSTQVELTVN